MQPVAHRGMRGCIGAVFLGGITIQACEPEALIKLAEALQEAAGRMEAIQQEEAAL
jgi:hypothetical protein